MEKNHIPQPTTSQTTSRDSIYCWTSQIQILKGTFDYSSLDLTKLQISYIKELKKHSGILRSPISNNISIENMKKGFQKWKETTSISPSNRHLGHYKALLVSDGLDYNEIHQQKSSDILHIHITLLNAFIFLGIPLDKWLIYIAIMIEKEKKLAN